MRAKHVNPVDEIYRPLQMAADHFNRELYGGLLPAHVFTLQRAKRTAGYFSPQRWLHFDGSRMSEIAINPSVLSNRPLWKLFQTIVREQCHLWQHTFGTPGRPGYHNAEWGHKMEEFGLIPTSTGRPGGGRTGQKMFTYPVSGGAFIEACVNLVRGGFSFPWVDQTTEPDLVVEALDVIGVAPDILAKLNMPLNAQILPCLPGKEDNKKKVNYRCPQCRTNVWGKPGIELLCACCGDRYEVV